VIGAVAEAGGDLTRINGVNFTVADPIQYYTQARQAAINDADHKAQKLAGLYGVKLDKPTVVFETNSSSPISHSYGLNAPQAVPTPTIVVNAVSLGSTDITLYIQASYPIIK
jgi:uncharacterized protein YggE